MDKVLGDKVKAIARDMRKIEVDSKKLREDIDELLAYINQREQAEGVQ